jgi:DNA-binding transcriptional ArsR family regulator
MSQTIIPAISTDDHVVLPTGAERVREGKALLRDDDLYLRVSEIFRALADSSRAKIVDALLHQELCTSDLAPIVGISESAVSQHLRMLRLLRVVKSHRHGNRVFYSLEDEHVRSLLILTVDHLQHQRTGE